MAVKVSVLDGGGSAWRARYLYVNNRLVASLGVDPNNGVTPQAFGEFMGKHFRVNLPALPWRYPASPTYLAAYKACQKFWLGVDGRYGWGTKHRAS